MTTQQPAEREHEQPDAPALPSAGNELRRLERTLAEVSAALGRLDDGSYGSCEACGSSLPDGLVTSDPLARLCERCGAGATGI